MKSPSPARLPPEIEVRDEPDRIVYRLPPRKLGAWRRVAIGFFVVAAFVLYQLANRLWDVAADLNRAPGWPNLLIGFVTLAIGSVIAYVPLGLGLAIAWGRREVELRGGRLRTTERAGPFWRTKKWPLKKIEKMSVVGFSESADPGPEIFSQLYALTGDLQNGKHFLIAPAFSRELLAPLATELARRCDQIVQTGSAEKTRPISVSVAGTKPRPAVAHTLDDEIDDDDPETDELTHDEDDDESDAAALTQPSGSSVVIERSATGLTATIPPAGLRAGNKGMFTFGVTWCVALAFISTVMIAAAAQKPEPGLPGLLAFISIFWLVGIGLLLGSVNMGRRRAAIAVVDDELMILQTSIFRSRSRTWKAGEVATVQAGPSGMEVNDRPVLELQVISASGDKFGLLAGRDERELRWLAGEIRQSLQLSAPDRRAAIAEIMQRDVDTPPPGSRITHDAFAQGFALTIPPAGIWRGSQGFVGLGLVMCLIMAGICVAEFLFGMRIGAHPIADLFTLGGWAASLAILIAGLNIGLRRAAIAVAKQRLKVVQSSFFGSKNREYAPDEVTAARAAPSGLGKDYEGLVELQILTRAGEKQSYLCGRDKRELFWIATLIRQQLGVPVDVQASLDEDSASEGDSAFDEPSTEDQADPLVDDERS